MPGPEQFDVSPQEKRNIDDRARLRQNLRKEFLRLVENPHRQATNEGGYAFDPALQRWISTRAQAWHYFKPNPKTLWAPGLFFFTVIVYAKILKWDRDGKENLYRTGQISYRDREFKFT